MNTKWTMRFLVLACGVIGGLLLGAAMHHPPVAQAEGMPVQTLADDPSPPATLV